MDTQAPFAAFPQHFLNIFDDDFNGPLQRGFQPVHVFDSDGETKDTMHYQLRQGQVFDVFDGDPKDPVHHQFQPGQVFEMSDEGFDDDSMFLDTDPIHHQIQPSQVFETSDEDCNGDSIILGNVPWEAAGLAYQSRQPSVVATEPPKHPSTRDWERIRPVFTRLYSTENRPLKDVKRILEQDHRFVASERMYKARIKSWKVCKNLKKAEKASLVRSVRQQRLGGEILHHGRPVNHRLARYCKENSVLPGSLDTPTHATRRSSGVPPVCFDNRAESAARNLQSLFRALPQPSTPIALHGGIRFVDEIMRNTHIYLEFYFSTGPGTRLYRKVDPIVAAGQELPAQQPLIFARNEEAWNEVVDPYNMYCHVFCAFCALNRGLIGPAFAEIEKAFALLKTVLEQQSPTLLSYLFRCLIPWAGDSSDLARTGTKFILDMAVTVLGDSHPLTKIVHQLCKLSVAAEKNHVWRAITDALANSFEVQEDSSSLFQMHYIYSTGAKQLGCFNEAETYLDMAYTTRNGNIEEQDPGYISEKANLEYVPKKYAKAEIRYRKCLQLLEDDERGILACDSSDSEISLKRRNLIQSCLFRLGCTLKYTDRIDEAKAMFLRDLNFSSAAFGPDSVKFQVAASWFDDFLTEQRYIEESAAFRAQHPFLLTRQEIPEELL